MKHDGRATRTRVERTPDGRRLVVSRAVSVPARVAWDVLVSTEDWPEWGPSVSAVRGIDGRIEAGSRGDVRVAGVWVPFTVETCGDHRWTWRVAGIPATGHRVTAVGVDRCEVAFEVPVLAAPYVAVCAIALRRIERLALAENRRSESENRRTESENRRSEQTEQEDAGGDDDEDEDGDGGEETDTRP